MKSVIHAWEIRGLINVSRQTKDTIKRLFRENYGSCRKAFQALQLRERTAYEFLGKSKSFTTLAKFFALTDGLGISREKVEIYIEKFRDRKRQRRSYCVNFPFTYSPLVLRSVAHIPGDGYVSKNGCTKWIQKEPRFMVMLLRKLLTTTQRPSGPQVTIPRFLVSVNCLKLQITPNELKSPRFIDAVMELPRRYRAQTLFALIVDEGNIDVKGNISIRMKKRDLVEAYAKLCDSLGYDRSHVIKIQNNGTFGRSYLWKFRIRAGGIRGLYGDYMDALATFGRVGGLWGKDQKFMERCQTALNRKATKDAEGREITKASLTLLSKHGELNVHEICNLLGSDSYDRIYDRIRYLRKRGKIKRVSYGRYALNQPF